MTRRPTIHDVAQQAGVSIKTVSRVVNGSDQTTRETRERVMTAVSATGYVPNSLARSLRTGASKVIGLIVDSASDPFFAAAISAIEDRALAHDMSVLVASSRRSAELEYGHILRLTQQQVDGLIIAPAGSDHEAVSEVTSHLPVVLFDRGWGSAEYDVARVDDHAGAQQATEHLLAHGQERIAFLGDSETLPTTTARLRGYLDALAAAGVDVPEQLVRHGCGDVTSAEVATRELLELPDPPTAIFSSNPRASLGVVAAIHKSSKPGLGLVGFGDFPLADVLAPGVTVIDQDPVPLANAAADRLLARIHGADLTPETIVIPLSLITRGSGEVRPQ